MSSTRSDDAIRRLLITALAQEPDAALFSNPDSWIILREHSRRFGLAEAVAFAARPHVSAEDRLWCDRQLLRSWNAYSKNLAALEFVLGILQEAQIDALCLKGPLLALRHYQPPFVRRPSVDLDIAIRERDLELACGALVRAGYLLRNPIAEARASNHELPLIHDSRPTIELHIRLSHSGFGLAVDEFIDRSLSYVTPNGFPARVLNPSDELFHLALHIASSRFSSFFHLSELHRLWRAAPGDVRRETVQKAIASRYRGMVRILEIAFRLNFDESFLPEGIALPRTWLNWRIDEALYCSLEDWLRQNPEKQLMGRLRGRWMDFQLTDGPGDALHWVAPLARLIGVRLRRKQWGAMRPVNVRAHQTPRGDKPGT